MATNSEPMRTSWWHIAMGGLRYFSGALLLLASVECSFDHQWNSMNQHQDHSAVEAPVHWCPTRDYRIYDSAD